MDAGKVGLITRVERFTLTADTPYRMPILYGRAHLRPGFYVGAVEDDDYYSPERTFQRTVMMWVRGRI